MPESNARHIKMLITDVDGVMTDGGMYFSSTGEEMKRFSARDGYAVNLCREHGIDYGIISSGHSPELVHARARVLKINHVYVGYTSKVEVLREWLDKLRLKAQEIAYIGDDLSDNEVIELVGFSACPADAASQIKEKVDVVLQRNGGDGCIREFVEEHLIPAKNG
jgi:3-deoxy-D-manno-octulosonate 8-phosphate phosphatase (KDO 8-P phosphatase)